MQIAEKKVMTIVVALFLLFAMAVSLVAVPNANAQPGVVHTKASHPLILAVPNPVGVNQPTLITFGITEGLQAVGQGWTGSITIERPDGHTETIGPVKTDSTGIGGTSYTPTMEGTYYLQYHFDEQDWTWAGGMGSLYPAGTVTTYKASVTPKYALNVTAEPTTYHPELPLPTEYWTRPIDANLRSWVAVSGDWLMSWLGANDRFHPVGNEDAPETAHILWEKPLAMGGIAGDAIGAAAFEWGDAYEGFWSSGGTRGTSVIIGGRLFYNQYKFNGGTNVEQEVVCVDLHTGEELWVRNWNNTRLAFGQNFFFESFNYAAAFPFLWTSTASGMFGEAGEGTWDAYNAFTGRWEYRMTNVPPGYNVYGPHGEIYRYYLDLANGWMMLLNTSRVVTNGGSFGSAYLGRTFNVSRFDYQTRPRNSGYEWNKTIPAGLPGSVLATFQQDRIIGGTINSTLGQLWGINVKPGSEGQVLFNTKWTAPASWTSGNVTIDMLHEYSMMPASLEDKIGIIWVKELREHYGFSLDTGEIVWGPSEPMGTLDYLEGSTLSSHIPAYGKLYSVGVSGVVKCFDIKTGATLWTYEAVDPYTEILYDNNWWIGIMFIADDKVYLGHGTHAALQPMARGAPFICLNATSGDEIWRANGLFRQSGWGSHAIIGDSILTLHDTYSCTIFAVGKGPSATTVAASPKVSVHGSRVLVEGMVTDISPGTAEYARTARFPNGVPAVADDVMSDWMLYVYKQWPCPSDAAGVEVVVEVLDPNYNYYEVGRVTSDPSGYFKCSFEPLVPGEYAVYATFAGSKSYYGSFDQTAIVVEEAAPATPPPTAAPESIADMYFLPMSIGIIIAIIIVGLLLFLLLRKR